MTSRADCTEELGGVLADVDANDDDSGDIQSHDSVENSLGGSLHGLARVVSLAGNDTDRLNATVCESGLRKNLPETKEAGSLDGRNVQEVIVPGFFTPVLATSVHY